MNMSLLWIVFVWIGLAPLVAADVARGSGDEIGRRRLSWATSNLLAAYTDASMGGTIELETGSTFAPSVTQGCSTPIYTIDKPAGLCIVKAVKFQCLDTETKCTLDGLNDKRIATVLTGYSSTTEFVGLIVTRGRGGIDSNGDNCGGILIRSSNVDISLCTFTSNTATVSCRGEAAWMLSMILRQ
jgi:hypothetical protein